jgi:H+/gluconate symporter-like permease
MKLNLRLGTPRPLTRAEAWGCVTGNLAVPGSGSLAAGRPVGYFQMALTFIGFILTLVCGAAFLHWYFANSGQFADSQQVDPSEALDSLWQLLQHARGAFFGIALFAFALAWAAITSFQILQAPRKDSAPPRIE